jgi:hypothetical protein
MAGLGAASDVVPKFCLAIRSCSAVDGPAFRRRGTNVETLKLEDIVLIMRLRAEVVLLLRFANAHEI